MAQINFDKKSVTVKIVYYGPGMSGKTSNLEIVHQRAPDESRGELTSISTDGDQALFFDFLPLDLGTVAGMRTQFEIYTVPGQVYYNSTRKLVLQGVDGVIFVADSSAAMLEENLEALRGLGENLAEYGRDLQCMPMVMQYNKRDMPDALPVGDLEQALNPAGWPSHEAVASTGQGVFPSLRTLAALVLESIHEGAGEAGSETSGSAAQVSGLGLVEAGASPDETEVETVAGQAALPSSSVRCPAPDSPALATGPPATPGQGPRGSGQAPPHGGSLPLPAPTEKRAPGQCQAGAVELGSHLQMAQAPVPEQASHLRMGQPICPDLPRGDLASQGGHALDGTPAPASNAVAGEPQANSVGGVMDMPGRVTVPPPPAAARNLSPAMAQRIRPRQSARATPAATSCRESQMATLAFGIAAFVAGVALGGLIFTMP